MTRCTEFYEKLAKDGNFCGMSEQDYKEAMDFWNDVEKDNHGNPCLSCDKWSEQRREEAKRFKDVEPEKSEPKHQNKSDFMEEATTFWLKARRHWSEEVIEEVLDKARVNTR